MALRRLQIGSLRFVQKLKQLSSLQEEQRLRSLIDDLKALCPQASLLWSSKLDTSKVSDEDGVILQYWLNEVEQRGLPLSTQRTARHQDAGNDGFANEVRQLTQEVTEARGHFLVAVEPTYTSEQLRSDDLFTRRVRKIRQRVRMRDMFQIPTHNGGGISVTTEKQVTLPTVYRANIQAMVHSGVPKGARLNDAKFIGDIPEALVGLSIPNQVFLRRPHTQDDSSVARMLDVAMDSRKSVRLSVLVNLNWVDGSVHSFTYADLYKRPYKKRTVPVG